MFFTTDAAAAAAFRIPTSTPALLENPEKTTVTPLPFELDIRTNAQGEKTLHFLFQSISDIHWGTRHTRARKLAHMFQHTSSDTFYIVGDAIDGEHLVTKGVWNFGAWHRQGLAAALRRQGVKKYIPGNHDEAIREQTVTFDGQKKLHRNLCGKSIYGIDVKAEDTYVDPYGFRLKIIHGDKFDKTLGSCGSIGNVLLEMMAYADTLVQNLPGCGHISVASKSKRAVKTIIDRFWSIRQNIASDVDQDPNADGILTGHSHISELGRTPGGKRRFNDGCCTENVETLVQDKNGTFALLEWHYGYLKITEENGKVRSVGWHELGLDSFAKRPDLKEQREDSFTAKADRLIRLAYRTWPPKERIKLRKQWAMQRAAGETVQSLSSPAKIPLPPVPRQKTLPAAPPAYKLAAA